jgi:DNA repair protein RadC
LPQDAATGEAELARILSPLFPPTAADAFIVNESNITAPVDMSGNDVPAAAAALAKRLIAEFGSLTALLAARAETVRRLLGPGEQFQRVAAFLQWMSEAFVTALRFEIQRAPIIGNSTALIDYLHMTVACETAEQFRVFFLDSARRLIRDEQLGIGSITATSVSPREIVKRALELGATSLILAHNHPSGDTRPSPGDIEMTAMIARAARCLDITVTDHIIISRTGWTSLRSLGML